MPVQLAILSTMIVEFLNYLVAKVPTLTVGTACIGFAAVTLWYYRCYALIAQLKAQGMKESPFPGSFLFGHGLLIRRLGFSRFVLESALKLGPEDGRLFVVRIGVTVYLVSADPDVMQTVAKTENLPKGNYKTLAPIVGNGLLTNRGGEDWKRKRQLFNPAFSVPLLKQVAPQAITNIGTELVKLIENSSQNHRPVDIHRMLSLSSLDLIGLVGFGYDFGCTQGKVNADVLHMMAVCLNEPTARVLDPLAHFYRIREAIDFRKQLRLFREFCMQVIHANMIRSDACPPEKPRKNIMSIALGSDGSEGGKATGLTFTDQQLVDEVSSFLFAGHETTAATMCFTIMLLGSNTDWQAKVREEVDSILGDRKVPTYEDQLKMRTLTKVIKETLRLFPAAPGTLRITDKPTHVVGFTIPAEVNIFPVFMAMQRHPGNFTEPLKFDPARWDAKSVEEEGGEKDGEGTNKDEPRGDSTQARSEESGDGYEKKTHPYAFVPFSAGPRNCIGLQFATMEMRMLIAHLLRRFTWTVEFPGMPCIRDPKEVLEHYDERITLHAKPFLTYFTVRNC